MRGALALAAHYFPRATDEGTRCVRIADALFFLSGQVGKWAHWTSLPLSEKARIAQLLRWRPVGIANRTVFADLLPELIPSLIPDFRVLDEKLVVVEIGGSPLPVVDECVRLLWLERELKKRHPMTIANYGEYVTLIRGSAVGAPISEVTYLMHRDPPVQPETPIALGDAAQAEEIEIPVEDLAAIASRLDATFGEQHRTDSVKRIFTHLQSTPDNRINGKWVLRAGPTRVLNAPTGVGKNVLAELVACWCTERGMVTSFLVPKNAVVVQEAHAIEASLAALGIDGDVVPLMSPSALQNVAETTASRADNTNTIGEWAYQRLSYACAQPAAAHTDHVVDAWQPGRESCTTLRKVKDDGTVSSGHSMCPWKPTCGKFRLARRACRASVIVTSHSNFVSGRLHVPVQISGRVEENLTVEELLIHRSHLILIDEIDAFQASLIGNSAKGLELAKRRGEVPAPLVRLDRELHDVLGRVDAKVEGRTRAAVSLARYLAESYTQHLASGHFRRPRTDRTAGHPLFGRWLLPRRWDSWLAATLFNLPADEPPHSDHFAALHALFPGENTGLVVPEWLVPVSFALRQITSPDSGDDVFDDAWLLIFKALADNPYGDSRLTDDEVRATATDRLIRRAFLERLRLLLFSFVYTAPQLHASGVRAANEVADALGQYAVWRATPYGSMGRVLFAFTETYDDSRPLDTTLTVSAFGGDPHTYVAALGELTALAHTGCPRIVLGLSATAYFPGAPHHHVYVPPTWWVPDDHTGGITVHASPISDEERAFLRISGTYGTERSAVLSQLGRLLWTKRLHPALRDLAADPDSAHRARLLLATTSYQGARDLAEGLSAAGVPREQIVLAIRPDDADGSGARTTARWTELPANQIEEFGRTVGTEAGSVLIAPLARAERGLNIVDRHGRSLIGSVWLVVRPIPILDEPPQLLAHTNARAHAEATPTNDPAAVLDLLRTTAAKHYDELFTSLPYFRSLPNETQLAIARETLVGLIQLAGRARRGGGIGEIHLVDYAFHDPDGHSDLPSLIRKIRTEWERDGHLELMQSLYGRTLQAIFDFADERKSET
ncbi:hypothetical protein SAMN05216215_1034103 [Saccharopolyspora shandongensis]|uniref:Helicase ATP-binding domain-containing protein n=2 Tax=Saccharopolyspora shandongensis TaxID=418495 RepID=A0A1H3MLC7_9PSEU|nr:hypothetical protein SAMN05216215_1034103 [Saccharopolyspora shandongensis]